MKKKTVFNWSGGKMNNKTVTVNGREYAFSHSSVNIEVIEDKAEH